MPDIRLLLVDDHEVVRTGLRMLLESQTEMKIVGEASTGAEALELCNQLRPDVVVMDLTLPDASGIEITRLIKLRLPQVNVVALTIHEDQEYFFEMLRAGASGYVPKRAAPDELVSAIRAAHTGEVYIFPSLAKVLVNDYLGHGEHQAEGILSVDLTTREEEVLDLLVQGWTNEEIAKQLVISKHTVARHRENIMRKLNLHNRSELVKYAIRKGLIEP
jgi:DNA-binding NarL/FixJ family response regulator